MEYTDAEQHAARRDALALIAAMHRGDDDAYNGILGLAGERGCRGIAETLVYRCWSQTLRLMLAASLLPEDMQQLVISGDLGDIAGVPGLRDSVGAQLAAAQAELGAEA
jgi:hypothetical protein